MTENLFQKDVTPLKSGAHLGGALHRRIAPQGIFHCETMKNLGVCDAVAAFASQSLMDPGLRRDDATPGNHRIITVILSSNLVTSWGMTAILF